MSALAQPKTLGGFYSGEKGPPFSFAIDLAEYGCFVRRLLKKLNRSARRYRDHHAGIDIDLRRSWDHLLNIAGEAKELESQEKDPNEPISKERCRKKLADGNTSAAKGDDLRDVESSPGSPRITQQPQRRTARQQSCSQYAAKRTGRSHGTRSGAALVTNAKRAPHCRNNIQATKSPVVKRTRWKEKTAPTGGGCGKVLRLGGWNGTQMIDESREQWKSAAAKGQEPNGASSSKAVLLGALGGFETGQEQAPEGLLVSVHVDRVASANVR
ncbi:hypothetical protein B0H14DRAFT_2598283 [Mycena olivaceomarginata]|nr:hypothetical protein B0H14DRAFT_2598283 [Mycena olivaceomarginata]